MQKIVVFDHIPKTAGTTMKFILRNSFGMNHCDANLSKKEPFTERELSIARRIFLSMKSISGHNLKYATNYFRGNGYFHLTVLRDPIKRCASHYQDNCLRHGNTLPLEEWIKNKKEQNLQTKHIAGGPDIAKAKEIIKNNYDFVAITEQFDDSVQLLRAIAPHKINIKYKRRIVAKDNTIKNWILNNPETLELVKKYNQLDMELYDYVLKEIYPLQKKRIEQIDNYQPQNEKNYKSVVKGNFQLSKFYNKFIYKIILKMIGERK